MSVPAYQPEKLNLWDRLFNRYRKEVADKGKEGWMNHTYNFRYSRDWVEYRIIDRLTGSVEIKREYLN